MSVHEIYVMAKEHGTILLTVVLILMSIIQIAPIKINPWTKFGKWLGRIFTGDIADKVDNIEEKLDQHIRESDERDLRQRRESILDFASAIAADKRRYSKEQYEQMLHECDDYLMYCERKKFKNAVAEESIGLIRDRYSERLAENSFLILEDEADK